MKQSIDLIDEIVGSGGISNTHLRMLVDKIKIGEGKNGLNINVVLKAQFLQHGDMYDEDGNLADCWIELHCEAI